MLDQVLRIFNISPDYDLDIMKPKQDLYGITSEILLKLRTFRQINPDLIPSGRYDDNLCGEPGSL
jgi:UDP-N-acetylglucosamine 2-epimerase (non-hydrolysing)